MQDDPDLPALHAAASEWIVAVLAERGMTRLDEVEVVRVRPWSTVMRVATSGGTVWFKAAAPATSFEVNLYPLLTAYTPDVVLEPLAADGKRGWLLLPDGGEHLNQHVDETQLVQAFVEIMPRYAEMQRTMARHVDDMLAAGVPDMRPKILPGRFDEVLESAREFVSRHGNEGHRELLRQVEALRKTYIEWCEAASALPGGASLDHNDLHARNILIPAGKGVPAARIYDWGDSVVAHPFTTLLVLLRYLQNELDTIHDDARLNRVRDAYLEAYGDIGSRDELHKIAMAICQIGKVTRAHGWMRALQQEIGEVDPEYASAPLEWLGELRSSRLLDRE